MSSEDEDEDDYKDESTAEVQDKPQSSRKSAFTKLGPTVAQNLKKNSAGSFASRFDTADQRLSALEDKCANVIESF